MYPSVDALMNTWSLLTAARVEIVDATEEVRGLLNEVNKEVCFRPSTWADLHFFAQLRPHADVLPVRARYDESSDSYNIGVNPLTASSVLWYSGPDLIASKLLTGRTPEIESAFRIVAIKRQVGLRKTKLGGVVGIDPKESDFFRKVIEERNRSRAIIDLEGGHAHLDAFLKVLANSGSYGIFAEMNRHELPESEWRRSWSMDLMRPLRAGPETRSCRDPFASLPSRR